MCSTLAVMSSAWVAADLSLPALSPTTQVYVPARHATEEAPTSSRGGHTPAPPSCAPPFSQQPLTTHCRPLPLYRLCVPPDAWNPNNTKVFTHPHLFSDMTKDISYAHKVIEGGGGAS